MVADGTGRCLAMGAAGAISRVEGFAAEMGKNGEKSRHDREVCHEKTTLDAVG